MWPWFYSQTSVMWVKFVVGSRPCSKGFSPGSRVFFAPPKPTFLIPVRSGTVDEEPPCGNATGNSHSLLFLIYLFIIIIIINY